MNVKELAEKQFQNHERMLEMIYQLRVVAPKLGPQKKRRST